MSNILDLNDKLFKTLDGLESGAMDAKKAQAVVNVSNAIINNAKLVLEVAKHSKNTNIAALMIGNENAKNLDYKDGYDKKNEFAISLGYKGLADAIGSLGPDEFKKQFQESQNQ